MSDEIKKIELSNRLFIILAFFLMGALVFLISQIYFEFKNLPENYPQEITVSAQGRAFAIPDIALIKFGVTTEGMKIQDIVKENTEKMNNILKEIKDLEIEEKDIQTISYNLTPRYEWGKEGQRIFRGYTLNQEIKVKIRKFEKIGQVLEKTTQIGANLVGDLEFKIDDPEKVREVARKEAIEKAKAKASQLASQSGLRLVKIINVYEDYTPQPTPFKAMPEGIGGGEISVAPEIQPGEEEVIVRVSLVYKIR